MSGSLVEYYSHHERYRCGYCGSHDTNYSHGMWAHAMTVSDYQDLIDRGWRRSGNYCYKPTMNITCCPMYTIRNSVTEFKASKSQKKVLKKFNKYLMGEDNLSTSNRKMSTCSNGSEALEDYGEGVEQFVESEKPHQDINLANVKSFGINTLGDSSKLNKQPVTSVNQQTKEDCVQNIVKKDVGPDPTKGPCKKAKQLRRERTLEKLQQKGIDINNWNTSNKNKEKQIEDFINESADKFKRKLEIKLVRTTPPSPEWLATAKETHQVYVKYQVTIHNDKPEKCSESKFHDFLVHSPLLEEHSRNGPPSGFGSFHQQYWLEGKLIAVGVIDILPKCVSSVYFFYDPQYLNLSLGTYGALREIEFTRHLHSICPEIQYYYLGFYIHSCRKMRYKGNFSPSFLLCPETYKWFPLKDCKSKLEASPYSRLDPDIDSIDEDCPTKQHLSQILVWKNCRVMPYTMYKQSITNWSSQDTEEITEYAELVGAKAVKSLVLVR